jgi:hypothetical protein
MSLINDALKKAQRLRAEQQGEFTTPPMPGRPAPGRIAKRGQAMPAQTLVLILGAAAVLIVLSAVATGYFLNRPSPPSQPATGKPAKVAATPDPSAPSPVIIAPVIVGPKPAPDPAPAAATPTGPAVAGSAAQNPPPPAVPATVPPKNAVENPPRPAVKPGPQSEVASAPPVQTAPAEIQPHEIPPAAPPAPAPAKPDPRIQMFVDSVRVAGIRYSGSESKVLMNDRVYRVNDVVDHGLNVRLKGVAPDNLTFVDANGITYVKNF